MAIKKIYANEHPKYKKKDKDKNIKVAKKSSAEKALDKQILGAKKHDPAFDSKLDYWNYLNTLDISPEEIGRLMILKFGE